MKQLPAPRSAASYRHGSRHLHENQHAFINIIPNGLVLSGGKARAWGRQIPDCAVNLVRCYKRNDVAAPLGSLGAGAFRYKSSPCPPLSAALWAEEQYELVH
jgi:hypothetical protein